MPLSVNVGLSRKASKDYQSTGVSINIVAELDQALLAKPVELQKQIDGLYCQAEQALSRQSGSPQSLKTNGDAGTDRAGRHNGHSNGASMTASQRRAILAIVERRSLDLDFECRHIIGVEFDQLSVRQASEFIDYLKGQQSAGNGQRAARQ